MSAPSSSDAAVDVEAVANAVASCPSVLRLAGGAAGQVVARLPGGRIAGIRIVGGAVAVHVVARWVAFLPDVGDEVRSAVRPWVGSRSVTVFIDDVGNPVDEQGGDRAALESAGKDTGE